MKRFLAAILIFPLTLGVNLHVANAAVSQGSACKKEGQVNTIGAAKYTCIKKSNKLIWNKGTKPNAADQGISVDKNLFSVKITIPSSFYEGDKLTQAELSADAAKKGWGRTTLNANGSVTFQMSKPEYAKVLAEMKKSVDDYIQETVNNSSKIFRKIIYNKSMTEFNISVNRSEFEEDFSAGMIGFGIGILASFYQMFASGTQDPKTALKFVDAATGKVFDTQNWPEKD